MTLLEKQERAKEDLGNVLRTPSGRRFIWSILMACQVLQHGFVPGDTAATSFHCGQKSIGLFILQDIMQFFPDSYKQMREEYESETKSKQTEIDRQANEVNLD